jgi:hypothetical protein
LWEADTFVPQFYKGKALPTYKSIVKLTAIPRFNTFASDPALYSYAWTANQIQSMGKGLGKQSVLVPMKYSGSSVPVEVTVTDHASGSDPSATTSATQLSSGSAQQRLVAVDPLILFYEDAPLLGIRFDRALFSWLWKFRAACREGRVRAAAPVLRDLHRASGALYDEHRGIASA